MRAKQGLTEAIVDEAVLHWLAAPGYAILPGPQIAPGELLLEHADSDRVVLEGRLQAAVARFNPAHVGRGDRRRARRLLFRIRTMTACDEARGR